MEHAVHTEDEAQYIVHNPKEVMQILNDFVKLKTTLKVSFNHGADIYLTTIIAVDVRTNCVYLDISGDEAFNRRLLSSDHVLFCKEDGIKVKWTSSLVSEVILKDGKAIKISLPTDMVRLQRREFFRFATPIANPVVCRIPLLDEFNPEQERELELVLLDVSLGGIGALTSNPIDPVLMIGTRFDHCKISFPDVGVTNLTLRVRNITEMPMADGTVKQRIGLEYIEPSRGNEGLINRYVHILERQAIALANGAG